MDVHETIAAIASAAGPGARGIVRVSGTDVLRCLQPCFIARDGRSLGEVRVASRLPGEIDLGPPLGVLPADVYLWPGPRSFTRQPCAEIHVVGSPPIVSAVLRAVCRCGARLAEPGEFTLRAFLAGRLDLTQAEAVLGVIDSHSEAELSVALNQLAGGLAAPLHQLRDRLLNLLAHLEAGLDFVEEDIEFISAAELDASLEAAQKQIENLAAQMRSRTESIDQYRVVLMGWPNVGKSSLLNAISGESAAIVSSRAGTTRDYVTRRVEIAGIDCLFIDTAGVDPDADHGIEIDAQRLGAGQFAAAHLQLLCLDGTRPLNDWEQAGLDSTPTVERLLVATKSDDPTSVTIPGAIETSAVTGRGLDELMNAIAETLISGKHCLTDVVPATATRCHESLRRAAASLSRARRIVGSQTGEELVAAEVRIALEEIGRVAGTVYTDDILDRIFSRFCIGK